MSASDHRPATLIAGGAVFPHRHLIGIGGLQPHEITFLLDEAEHWVEANRTHAAPDKRLAGLTLINAFSRIRRARCCRSKSPASGSAPTSSTCTRRRVR